MTIDTPSLPTVLLVEDDPMLRRLIRSMLQGAGYDLLVAPNGEVALTMAGERAGTIDLLLTDVVMPRMNGFELSGHITSTHPETSVLFLSGYADDSNSVRAGLKTTRHAFLLKPFTKDALLEKIQEVLVSKLRASRTSRARCPGSSAPRSPRQCCRSWPERWLRSGRDRPRGRSPGP